MEIILKVAYEEEVEENAAYVFLKQITANFAPLQSD